MEIGSTLAAAPKSFTATNEIANPECGKSVGHRCHLVQSVDFTPALAATHAKVCQSGRDALLDTLVDPLQRVTRAACSLFISA